MPLRLQSRIHSLISSSTAEERDIGNIAPRSFEISDALSEGSTRKYRVADGTSNQDVDLAGLLSAQYIVVRTTRAVSVRLNGTSTIPVGLVDSFQYGYLMLTAPEGGVTSMDVSNSSGGTAEVLVQLVGEAS